MSGQRRMSRYSQRKLVRNNPKSFGAGIQQTCVAGRGGFRQHGRPCYHGLPQYHHSEALISLARFVFERLLEWHNSLFIAHERVARCIMRHFGAPWCAEEYQGLGPAVSDRGPQPNSSMSRLCRSRWPASSRDGSRGATRIGGPSQLVCTEATSHGATAGFQDGTTPEAPHGRGGPGAQPS